MKISSLFAAVILVAVTGLAAFADKLTIRPDPAQVDGVQIATAADEKIGFHNAAPVVQRASADQVAVSTNALAVAGAYSQAEVTAIAARATALTVLANEIRAALVQKGLIKGTN